MASCEELLEMVLTEDESQDKHPRFSEFSPETEALYIVADRLGDVCSGLVGLGGGKPKRTQPLPRPKTAVQRVKDRQRRVRHEALVARVLPANR